MEDLGHLIRASRNSSVGKHLKVRSETTEAQADLRRGTFDTERRHWDSSADEPSQNISVVEHVSEEPSSDHLRCSTDEI